MTRPIASRARKAALTTIGAALTVAAVACGDDIDARPEAGVAEADALRLGRIHVVMEPSDETVIDLLPAEEEQLAVTARFAFVRGLEEDFARSRMKMPLLSHEVLSRNQCTAEDLASSPDADADTDLERELMLVDAGDMRLHTGDATLQVPLSLVPDLLPYMTGVEYVYYSEPMAAADSEALASVVIDADGSPGEELPPFTVESAIPATPTLAFFEEDLDDLARDALVLHWSEASEPELPITLTFTPLKGDEPIGDDITCVFDDVGQARVDMQHLYTLGLPHTATHLMVTASRAATTTFDAGAFTGSELVVERRSAISVPMP